MEDVYSPEWTKSRKGESVDEENISLLQKISKQKKLSVVYGERLGFSQPYKFFKDRENSFNFIVKGSHKKDLTDRSLSGGKAFIAYRVVTVSNFTYLQVYGFFPNDQTK